MPSTRFPGRHASREEIAERVALWIARNDERGRPHTFDANHLGKLERGTVHRPGPLIRAALCAVFDATEADLGFAPGPDDDRLAAAVSGRLRPDDQALDAVASILASLRRLEDATSAAEVLPSVRQQTALAARLAENACGSLRRRAVGLLSELEQYQGWLAIPVEQWGESRTKLDRAAVLAMEAGDPLRLSTALSFAAYRNLRRGDLRSADALNEAAAHDERVHHGLRTYINYQRAEVLARDNSRSEAVRLLDLADTMTESAPDDEPPDSGYWYVPAFFLGQRAFVLRALGDIKAARQAATDSLAEMPESWRTAEWGGASAPARRAGGLARHADTPRALPQARTGRFGISCNQCPPVGAGGR